VRWYARKRWPYPSFRAHAAHCGVTLEGLPFDTEGIDPDAFEAACRVHKPKALYCNPTLQNPTTTTISEAQRHALVGIARRHGVAIIEDDAYGRLPRQSPPPFAVLAPEITHYVSGLAKCAVSGLRIAYLVSPDARHSARLAATLNATTVMAAPLMAALATRWIADGTADAVLAAIRREAIARQQLASELLNPSWVLTQPEALHFWLRLPQPWSRVVLMQHLRSCGIGVVVSDAFTVSGPPPEAVRVCLGGPAGRAEIKRASAYWPTRWIGRLHWSALFDAQPAVQPATNVGVPSNQQKWVLLANLRRCSAPSWIWSIPGSAQTGGLADSMARWSGADHDHLEGTAICDSVRDSFVRVVRIGCRNIEIVQPQRQDRMSPTRRREASGGYIHMPWMAMQLLIIRG
jgi:histidinol-phosphate/aromatic aminotransferase/cobyric acid decarboxylase-like protein